MHKSFTLIELIVVIAIIAILAAIIAPNAFKAIEKANRSATLGDWKSIKTAAMTFYADTGRWPTTGCNESLLVDNTCDASGAPSAPVVNINGWDGPYVEPWPPRTRWGGVYAFNSNNNINWDGVDASGSTAGGGDESRYLSLNSTAADALLRLDEQIDGTAVDAGCDAVTGDDCGQHRWEAGPLEYLLLSTEVNILN